MSRNAKKKHFRNARLGKRPAPSALNVGDAVHVVDAARTYRQGWKDSAHDAVSTWKDSWDCREVGACPDE